MTEQIDPICLFDNPPARRLWLLMAAVRSLPFDRAVELARVAEAFVTGSPLGASTHEAVSPPMARSEYCEQPKQTGDAAGTNAAILADGSTDRNGMALSHDDRDRLLDGLAKGTRNAVLATEFGVSRKQVQGLRMGCAREIARRRAQLSETPSGQSQENDQDPAASVSIDEIVRYLRQQDDVVVPQEDGGYMVNGRFRLSPAELVARANRMRSRQHKPSFQMRLTNLQGASSPGTGSNPVFWETRPAVRHSTNGPKQPAEIDTDGV